MKKMIALVASLFFSAAALAGPLTTTVKVNGNSNTVIGLDTATRVTFANNAITVYSKGGGVRYYSDYAGSAKYAMTMQSSDFKAKFVNSTSTDWVNTTLGELTCASGATKITYFADGTSENIFDGCAAAYAAVNNTAN